MHSEGKTYAEIGQILNCSNKMIETSHVQLFGKNIGPRKQKTSV